MTRTPTRGRLPNVLFGVALTLAATVAAAQTAPPCIAPPLDVTLVDVTSTPSAGGTPSTVLHVQDPNPAGSMTGYNLYRSSDPSLPKSYWTLLAVDVTDADPATPGIQLVEPAPDPSGAAASFYVVTALNGSCGLDGPWTTSTLDDFDRDGIGAADDPCPTTPPGAAHLMRGCSATDLLLLPEVLVGPADDGIVAFVAGNADAGIITPDDIAQSLDAARVGLASAFDQLRAATPCPGAASLGSAVGHMGDALVGIEEYLARLAAPGAPPGFPDGSAASTDDGTEGPVEWPSLEVLHWQGQHSILNGLVAEATRSSSIADQVCAAEGSNAVLEGRVRSISDDKRLVELESGARIVLAWNALQEGTEQLAEDTDVAVQGTQFSNFLVGKIYNKLTPSGPFLGGSLNYDGCIRLRIVPIQPLPGYPVPQSSWIRHLPEAYQGTGGRLELEAGTVNSPIGTLLMVEDSLCPGVFPVAGPSGEDLRLDYYYEIRLTYKPRQGNWVTNAVLALALDGDSALALPSMDASVDGTLVAKKMKRTCLDNPLTLPKDWACSAEQTVESTSYPIRVRQGAYCVAPYAAEIFDIEDHDPGGWRQTQVQSVWTLQGVVPAPVAFSAIGDPIVNGNPVHNQVVGVNQSFAIYNPFGHFHAGAGTSQRSFLDWPHITGIRNNQPFRYSCTVSKLVTDRISACADWPPTYYRMPFAYDVLTKVNQGNGGSASHNTWQWYALDLSGAAGDALRAARGGKVVQVRKNATLNCYDVPDPCPPYGAPLFNEYGNHVAIQHQDGTVGWYAHMLPFTSPLVVGQTIKRGDYLGQIGSTGRSTGAHLHFHVTPAPQSQWGSTTRLSRYEAYSQTDETVVTCAVPLEDQFYYSTNLP